MFKSTMTPKIHAEPCKFPCFRAGKSGTGIRHISLFKNASTGFVIWRDPSCSLGIGHVHDMEGTVEWHGTIELEY